MDPARARALLHAERADALAVERGLAATFDDLVAAARDSNLDDEHDPEGSTIAAERSLVTTLRHSATTRLAELDRALARVDEGTFGLCLQCGAAIADVRLEARPISTTCMPCASGRAR